MNQPLAVWLLIALALATANLPFIAERVFLVLPWAQAGEAQRPAWRHWLEFLVFLVLLTGLGYATLGLIGKGSFAGSDPVSVLLFFVKLIGVFVVAAVLLGYAGWRNRGRVVKKSFFERLLEVLMFYALIGTLGFAFEANIGNPFKQTWEFYSITLCLFLVLGYPGFVYRYLLRRSWRHRSQ